MGFIICSVRRLDERRTSILPVRRLSLGTPKGLFARHLPALAAGNDGTWTVSAPALLRLEQPDADDSLAIMLDLTPGSLEELNLYQLLEVTGRTGTHASDLILRFRTICSRLKKSDAKGEADGEWTVSGWGNGSERYEQLRLEGGASGGDWSWSESDRALSATLVRKASG